MTSGEIPMLSGYDIIEDNLLVKQGAVLHADKLTDDLALIIQSDRLACEFPDAFFLNNAGTQFTLP
jgi:hypothetical protein